MTDEALLEAALRDLPAHGSRIKNRPYRQVWRLCVGGRPYYLKFYPRSGSRLKRLLRGSAALREFSRLQMLQKAQAPAPRAVAALSGFVVDGVKGDAVILRGIEPARTLDEYFNQHHLEGTVPPDRRLIASRLIDLLEALGRAGLGHDDLHLGNLLWDGSSIYLLDAHALTTRGLRTRQLCRLGHSIQRYSARGDLLRAWRRLAGKAPIPLDNPVSPGLWRKFLGLTGGGNAYFGRLRLGAWRAVFFRKWKYPYRYAPAGGLEISDAQWERALSAMLQRIESGQLQPLKQSGSGQVLQDSLELGGKRVEVIIKMPRRKKARQWLTDLLTGPRVRRAWRKSWEMITRNIPAAWPLAALEERRWGITHRQIFIAQRVEGSTLAQQDLSTLAPAARRDLFFRCGRILRTIERRGYCHFDPKSSNWIIAMDPLHGPWPTLVDLDGVRPYRWDGFGVQRLLRSMKEHPQYTPEDSFWLCRGYAPHAPLVEEPTAPDEAAP